MTTSPDLPVDELPADDVVAAGAVDMIKKKDIYDHVTVTTGLRRREVREAIDATFAYLHDSLSAGKTVQCPPLGKIRVIPKGQGDNEKLLYRLNLQKPRNNQEPDQAADDADVTEDE